jgi:hypothetical protein
MTDTQTSKTPEELAQMRGKLKIYYREQIEVLKYQKEYEILLADIDEARLKRMTSIVRMAQLQNQPKEDQNPIKESIPDLNKVKQK